MSEMTEKKADEIKKILQDARWAACSNCMKPMNECRRISCKMLDIESKIIGIIESLHAEPPVEPRTCETCATQSGCAYCDDYQYWTPRKEELCK